MGHSMLDKQGLKRIQISFQPWLAGFPLILLLPLLVSAQPATEISTGESFISIRINSPLENDSLRIARFNNPITRVILKTGDEEIDLKLTPQPSYWNIALPPRKVAKGTEVLVETIGKPYLAGKPIVVQPDSEGIIKLHAHLGTAVGEMLRYEPQPHKNTIGYWVNEEDFVEWIFQIKKPGNYRVEILQGCGKGQGGSEVAIQLGEEDLKYTVKDTGHFQNFERRTVGTLKLESTEPQKLQIKVLNKANKAVMDVRLIELIPVDLESESKEK